MYLNAKGECVAMVLNAIHTCWEQQAINQTLFRVARVLLGHLEAEDNTLFASSLGTCTSLILQGSRTQAPKSGQQGSC